MRPGGYFLLVFFALILTVSCGKKRKRKGTIYEPCRILCQQFSLVNCNNSCKTKRVNVVDELCWKVCLENNSLGVKFALFPCLKKCQIKPAECPPLDDPRYGVPQKECCRNATWHAPMEGRTFLCQHVNGKVKLLKECKKGEVFSLQGCRCVPKGPKPVGNKNRTEVSTSTTDADKEVPGAGDSLVSTSPLGEYRYAGVAAPNPECSEIATEMLAKCGSAVDAAIAALLCTAVGSPQNSGLGGGFFMIVYKRETNETTIIDARETAPAAATERMYLEPDLERPSVWGGLAVAVPGDVAGMWEAHSRFGNLAWEDLFQPAIKMAQDGVKVTPHMYHEAKGYMDNTESKPLDKFKELRDMLTKDGSDDELLEAGDTQKRPKLANTLQVIANEGSSAFYDGSLTDTIVKEIQEFGGIITKNDLKNYVAKVKKPVVSTLKDGSKIYGPPPPSGGIVVQFILALLDGFDLEFESVEEQVESYHKIAEAFKWGFAKRTYFGDTDFQNGTLTELISNMTNPDFVASIRARITEMNMTANASHYSPFSVVADAGTTHISVLAPNGDAVSVTSSINWGYGSLVKGNVTGILYNNEMDDFSTPGQANAWGFSPSPSNFIEPGKRMQSSMSPTIVTDSAGDVALVVGAAGGSRIITATSLVALHTLKRNKNIKQAIDARRIHHQLLPPVLNVEDGISDEVKRGLEKRGYVINPITVKGGTFSSGGSAVQGVHRAGHKDVKANSDFRLSGGDTDGF